MLIGWTILLCTSFVGRYARQQFRYSGNPRIYIFDSGKKKKEKTNFHAAWVRFRLGQKDSFSFSRLTKVGDKRDRWWNARTNSNRARYSRNYRVNGQLNCKLFSQQFLHACSRVYQVLTSWRVSLCLLVWFFFFSVIVLAHAFAFHYLHVMHCFFQQD